MAKSILKKRSRAALLHQETMFTDRTVIGSWKRIHAWMKSHQPNMLKLLRCGASEEAIKKLESTLGVHLPDDFKTSYRIHDGATSSSFFGGAYSSSFFSTRDIVYQWRVHKKHFDVHGTVCCEEAQEPCPIENKLWLKGWIPFGADIEGSNLCVDLEPTKSGTFGQVMRWYKSDYGWRSTTWTNGSFTDYLDQFAIEVENGKYALSEDGKNLTYKTEIKFYE